MVCGNVYWIVFNDSFLNIIYANISTKQEKQILIFSFVVLTALPCEMNIQYKIVPSWWIGFYPVMYYFIGCYLKEFGLKIGLLKNAMFLLVMIVVAGMVNYHFSFGQYFIRGAWAQHNSLITVCLTVLLFSFFLNLNLNNIPHGIKKLLQYMSNYCFGAYLVSYIFDRTFYPILNSAILDVEMRFKYYFIIVPIIYVCSQCLSAGINALYTIFTKSYHYLKLKKY